jgi:hypothetical protein
MRALLEANESSTKSVKPQISYETTSACRHPHVSTIAPAGRNHFASLTVEQEHVYRNWRRAALLFHAVFIGGIAAIAIAIGPGDQSSTAKRSDIYSALASTVQRSSH